MLARALPVLTPIPKTHAAVVVHQQHPTRTTHSQSEDESTQSFPLNQPSKPDLADISDRGFFNNDDITNEVSPMITGSATPFTSVEVLL